MKNERPDIWDAMLLCLSGVLVVNSVLMEDRIERLSKTIHEMEARQRASVRLLEAQQAGCASAMADWQKWLQIRKDQWGAAWFIEMKEDRVDD